uniref:Uncharacterized protein n=1 Tax=Picea sitchensis TaxID=3332 RepID=A9NRM8_PICSI|nr:unknown [Picea sitchensis]
MQGYSRIRGSRSVDLEEPNWKDFRAEVKPSVKGSAKWAFNSNDSRGRDPDFVKEEKGADPSAQIGFMLSRALSLKESMKQHKISHRTDDSLHGAVSTVKRAFSMRKTGPPSTAKPCVDFYSADWQREEAEAAVEDESLSRSTSMSYSRIAPAGEEEAGSAEKNKNKKRRGVLKACKRLLLGKQRN